MSKSKWLIGICVGALIVCALSGGLVGAQEKKVIGVANQWLGNDWNYFCNEAVKSRLEELGYKVIDTNAMGETRRQVADVENFLSMGVDGVVIKGGEGYAFFDLSEKLWKAGIPCVGVDMYLPGAVASVSTNNYEGGVKLGMFLVNKMHREGKIIVLDTPGWQTLEQRRRCALAVLKDFPEIKIISEHEVGTAAPVDSAYTITKAVLRAHPDLKGILCTWGLPLVGASKAVRELGKQDQVVIVCADNDRPVLQEMARPDAPAMACLGQRPDMLGKIAAELIDKAVKAGSVEKARATLPTVAFGPTLMISNVDPISDFSEVRRQTVDESWEEVYAHKYKKPW